jgi:hypothetical protein
MASRQKYRKMVVQNGDRVTGKNSCVGMVCISDYRQDEFNRVLVFERPEKLVSTESTKGLTKRQRARNKAANGANPQDAGGLAFPGAETTSA